MAASVAGRIVRLSDTNLTVAAPAADIRGLTAHDRRGEEIGTVEDLLIDDEEHKVRFLRIGSGGFLGIGKDHFLVPVDAVEAHQDRVIITRDRERLRDAPEYDPDLAYEDTYYSDVYGWWGHTPYWSPGYVYPRYPDR
jgi:sporulation protein YlmC with PRC-barrel domain